MKPLRDIKRLELLYKKGTDIKKIQQNLMFNIDEIIRNNGYEIKNRNYSKFSAYSNYSKNEVEFHTDSKRVFTKPMIKLNFCINCYNPKDTDKKNIYQKAESVVSNLVDNFKSKVSEINSQLLEVKVKSL